MPKHYYNIMIPKNGIHDSQAGEYYKLSGLLLFICLRHAHRHHHHHHHYYYHHCTIQHNTIL